MLGFTTGRGLELVEVGQAGLGAEELEVECLGSFGLAWCEEPGAGKDLLAAWAFAYILSRGFSDLKDWYFILTIVIAVLGLLEVLAYYGTIHDEISMNSIVAQNIHDGYQ